MKRILSFVLALVMLASAFTGCGQKGEEAYVPTGDAMLMEGEEPEVTLPDDPALKNLTLAYAPERSMNPLIGMNHSNRVLFSLIYQPLFALDSRNTPWPILAAGMRMSDDRKIYTILLDRSATFSDGSHVTPDDVLESYQAAKASDLYAGHFTHILDMKVNGDDGITFYVDTPFENFMALLDIPIMKAGQTEEKFPIGTGPYVFHDEENVCTLVKRTDWWAEKQVVLATQAEVIRLEVADSQAEIRDKFQFGGMGLAAANPMTDSYADYRCDYELWETENGVMLYLGVNVLYSDFFKNDNYTLRRALSKAIDRDTINKKFYKGKCLVSPLPTAPNSVYYSKSLASQYTYDPMGFVGDIIGYNVPRDENGQRKKLKLLVNSDDSARLRTARYIAAELTELGIETGVLEYGAVGKYSYNDILRAGTYDLYLGEVRLNPLYDLSEFFRSGGRLSWGGIVDGTILAMMREALADRGNYYNLNKLVADDAKIIPILFGSTCVYANRGQLLNLAPARDNAFFYKLDRTLDDIRIQTEEETKE